TGAGHWAIGPGQPSKRERRPPARSGNTKREPLVSLLGATGFALDDYSALSSLVAGTRSCTGFSFWNGRTDAHFPIGGRSEANLALEDSREVALVGKASREGDVG